MSESVMNRPKVGVSLLVVKWGRVLLSRRDGSHGAGEYGTPGGHQELGETYEETALRELSEECGPDLMVTAPRFLCVTNLRQYLPEKHYTNVGMVAYWNSGTPIVPLEERDKIGEWAWYLIGSLPIPCFGAVRYLVDSHRTNRPYYAD